MEPFGNPNMIVWAQRTQAFCVSIVVSLVCSNMSCCLFKNKLLFVQKHGSKYLFWKCFKWHVSLYALKMSLLVNEIVPWSCVERWFGQQDAKQILQPQVSLAQLRRTLRPEKEINITCWHANHWSKSWKKPCHTTKSNGFAALAVQKMLRQILKKTYL